MLDFEFVWSVAEHARAQHAIAVKRFQTEGKILFILIPLGVLVLASVLSAWAATQGEWLGFQVLAPVIILFAAGNWYYFWGRGRLDAWHQRRTDSNLQHPIHHLLSEHGLRVRGRSAEVTIGWRSMPLVAETPDYFLFYYSDSAAYYLPKRVAEASQLAELRTLIRANTRNAMLDS